MDAKELRIGNYITYDGKLISIDGVAGKRIYHSGCLFDQNIGEYKPFKPIELTDEWLLRLGIKLIRSNKDSGYKEYGIKKNGFNIVLSIPCNEPPACYVNGVFVEIDYVHQFQNLCFVLTGEELMPQ